MADQIELKKIPYVSKMCPVHEYSLTVPMNPYIKKDFELNACGIRAKRSTLPVVLFCSIFIAIVAATEMKYQVYLVACDDYRLSSTRTVGNKHAKEEGSLMS